MPAPAAARVVIRFAIPSEQNRIQRVAHGRDAKSFFLHQCFRPGTIADGTGMQHLATWHRQLRIKRRTQPGHGRRGLAAVGLKRQCIRPFWCVKKSGTLHSSSCIQRRPPIGKTVPRLGISTKPTRAQISSNHALRPLRMFNVGKKPSGSNAARDRGTRAFAVRFSTPPSPAAPAGGLLELSVFPSLAPEIIPRQTHLAVHQRSDIDHATNGICDVLWADLGLDRDEDTDGVVSVAGKRGERYFFSVGLGQIVDACPHLIGASDVHQSNLSKGLHANSRVMYR